jgi:hypothetical protein
LPRLIATTILVGYDLLLVPGSFYAFRGYHMSNTFRSSFRVLVTLFGAALLSGCGDSTPSRSTANNGAANSGAVEGGPKTNGEPASSGEKPGTAAPKPADPDAVDLRTLPQVERAKFTVRTANRLEGTTGDTATAIYDLYRSALEKLGWKLSTPPAKDQVTEDSALGLLNKGDDSIVLSVVPFGAPGDKEKPVLRQFTVDYLGACDSSKLPRLPGAEAGYGSKISSVYFTDMKAAATAASVKNLLVANGWQPYTKPYASAPVMPDRIRDQYRKEGNSLRVIVGPKLGKENTSIVEYVIGAIGHQLPAPPDATDVEFDDAMCLMRCNVPRDVDPVAKYYSGAMAALGFEVGNYAVSEMKTVIICKSIDQDAIVELNYEGINTHVDLRGYLPKDRKKKDEDAKKP